ncbi:major facilitator superfamily transporter [Penicillium longicatenatum]|uniref:major facilitator superfamily transporter n=1 Tax=Penicillium longicatenatum TaxID=1561947 RepID=UPI00254833F8|nr:major facilitator superfamily transporter [Penicillium longicatenatum]KAJ5649300.1 major facilitator superfamily transporter [Penicillium longicatenatum]
MEATVPIVIETKDAVNQTIVTSDVDYVQEDVQARVSKPIVRHDWLLVVLTMLSSTFLFSLDNTIVADVQSPIIKKFGEVGKLSWLGVAFVLASSATMVTWGKLYGIFSAKWIYVTSVVLFEAGSAVCGAAPNMNAFIIGRAIAGLGGAGMYLGCLTLLSITTSVRQRPTYMALTGITWGSGTVLGPVVGGAFAQNVHTTWRWAFYINLCIGAVFAPVYIFFLPRADPQECISLNHKLQQIDYLGAVLNAGALAALVMAISFGGNLFDWEAGREIALWVVGGVLLLLFGLQQAFKIGTTREERIFPADLLRMPIMWLLFALMCAASTCVFIPTYYIPIYCQFVKGDSPLTAAVRLLPFIVLMVFSGLSNGALMSNLGYYMPWYLAGGILASIGGGLMSTIDETSPISYVYGYSALIGIGAGMFIQTGFSVAQAKVSPTHAADATSFIAFAQNIGIVIALAISGSLFQNQALDSLQDLLPGIPRETLRGAISGSNSELIKKIPAEAQAEVLHAIVHAMSHTYYLVIAAAVMTALGSLFFKRERIFVQATTMG